jgi:hypothetical protein
VICVDFENNAHGNPEMMQSTIVTFIESQMARTFSAESSNNGTPGCAALKMAASCGLISIAANLD